MIYFIQCGEFVKIGYSENVEKRLAALQVANPLKLRLMKSFAGDYDTEKKIHELFSDCRVSGEWFSLTDRIEEYKHEAELNLDVTRVPFKKDDEVLVICGKHEGRTGFIVSTPLSTEFATVGLYGSSQYWTRAVSIQGDFLQIEKRDGLPFVE